MDNGGLVWGFKEDLSVAECMSPDFERGLIAYLPADMAEEMRKKLRAA